ncbi:hypothetical protein DFH29DRAFT_1065986 [Suillus ampliporus]|nr:hypothetical protein DFH29DRAFT_1065986 [Suillus ampliporus]
MARDQGEAKAIVDMKHVGAITSADGTMIVSDNNPSDPATFIAATLQNSAYEITYHFPVLTVGGWDGSIYSHLHLKRSYDFRQFHRRHGEHVQLQGVEFEYDKRIPRISSMLQELKQQLSNVSLSDATPVKPWNDTSGNRSAYSAVDIFWRDYELQPAEQIGSATSAVKLWTAAGLSANQPASGDFNFWGLIAGGFLNEDDSVASGITDRRFDNCSPTALYVFNSKTQVTVAYDNAQSFTAKGNFIGFTLWEMGGIHNNILLNVIDSTITGSS